MAGRLGVRLPAGLPAATKISLAVAYRSELSLVIRRNTYVLHLHPQ